MRLTNADIAELIAWRHLLHRRPELSGEEGETARKVAEALRATGPDRLLTALGGTGVAAVYRGQEPGPTVMVRAELDALPIQEKGQAPHRSEVPGKAHLCGHDGHMTILAALARGLGRERPERGQAVLLFQPAEENGAGAAAVVADPAYRSIRPDWAFALHNVPGLPVGQAMLAAGPVNCASRGLRITLEGRTAHASQPETGVSPMRAVAALLPGLTALGPGGPVGEGYALVTVTHVRMGERAFGVAPGEAEIWATLRTLTDGGMGALMARAEALAREAAEAWGLTLRIAYDDVFGHCENDPEAVAVFEAALAAEGIRATPAGLPMRGSEDFGRFGAAGLGTKAAMVFLGAGEATAPLHDPDYDFPDDLIPIGARLFMRTLKGVLG